MNFSSLKNISTMYLYFISIVCFIASNYVRDNNQLIYVILLVFGLGFFILGFFKRLKNK